MCGIVGLISRKQNYFYKADQDLFQQMLICDSVRGLDSTGVFGVNKYGNVDYHKSTLNPLDFIKTPEYTTFNGRMWDDYNIVVGHNRKATHGTVSDQNAHPFAEGNIVLVHNGTITNHKSMKDVDVDSHAICHSIAEDGYNKTLSEINGAYALVWYDAETETLHLARNKERPLWVGSTESLYVIASEPAMMHWLVNRNATTEARVLQNVHMLKEDLVYSLTFDNKDAVIKKEEVKKEAKIFQLPFLGKSANESDEKKSESDGNTEENKSSTAFYVSIDSEEYFRKTSYGGTITFVAEDWKFYEDIGEKNRSNADGYIIGHHYDFPDIAIQCEFRGDEAFLEGILEGEYLTGLLERKVYNPSSKTRKLHLSYPVAGWLFVTGNKQYLTDEHIRHIGGCTCDRCHTQIQIKDIPETFIKPKQDGNIKILCHVCYASSLATKKKNEILRKYREGDKIVRRNLWETNPNLQEEFVKIAADTPVANLSYAH